MCVCVCVCGGGEKLMNVASDFVATKNFPSSDHSNRMLRVPIVVARFASRATRPTPRAMMSQPGAKMRWIAHMGQRSALFARRLELESLPTETSRARVINKRLKSQMRKKEKVCSVAHGAITTSVLSKECKKRNGVRIGKGN